MYEVELKISLQKREIITPFLEKNMRFLRTTNQEDHYFSHPCRDFVKSDEALRIRIDDGIQKITYKGPKLDKNSKTRKEIEFNVPSSDLVNLLNELGFSLTGVVRKTREIWEGEGFIISMDDVSGLGYFVELETELEDETEITKTVEFLSKIVEQMGLDPTQNIRESYLELLESIQK